MYVVRLRSIDGISNFSAFRSQTLALSHFETGQSQVIDEILNGSALFGSDPRIAHPDSAGW
jgi:hypothetical protein